MWYAPNIFEGKILKKCKNNTGIAYSLCNPRVFAMWTLQLLHHSAHSRCTTHWGRILLGLIHDEALGGEEHACDRGSVLKSNASHLGRVNHTSLAQVFEYVGAGIITEVAFALAHLLYYHGTLATGICDNLTQKPVVISMKFSTIPATVPEAS